MSSETGGSTQNVGGGDAQRVAGDSGAAAASGSVAVPAEVEGEESYKAASHHEDETDKKFKVFFNCTKEPGDVATCEKIIKNDREFYIEFVLKKTSGKHILVQSKSIPIKYKDEFDIVDPSDEKKVPQKRKDIFKVRMIKQEGTDLKLKPYYKPPLLPQGVPRRLCIK